MKYILILFIILGIVGAVELPVLTNGTTTDNPTFQDQQEPTEQTAGIAAWHYLKEMSAQTRENARIELILNANSSPGAEELAHQIEELWNQREFESALSLFPQLEKLTDILEMAIGITWRTPIVAQEQGDWANDVRIGTRDSIYVNAFDIHRASGNLFVILLYQSGSYYYWSVNLSTNGGSTWAETYQWNATYKINHISATVLDNHCFVAYIGNSGQTDARLRQFKVTDGQPENFSNGQPYITVFTTAGDSIREVALTSNQDFFNNRLYFFFLCNNGDLHYFWSDAQAVFWNEIATYISDADRGLDASCNEGYASYFVIASYINTSNQVKVITRNPGKSFQRESGEIGLSGNR